MKNIFKSIGGNNNNSLTNLVKSNNDKQFSLSWFNYIPALITNLFSIVFSSSIIFELRNILSGYALLLLSIFILLFLILNESIKVIELRKFVKGCKNSLVTFLITFLISLTLASIGIWFFTNKSMETKDNSNIEKNISINNINSKYQLSIDNINNNNIFENSKEYIVLNNDLTYWKRVSAASLEERNSIRERIGVIQNNIVLSRNKFNENKNNSINNINNLKQQEINIINSKYNKNNNESKKNNFISFIFLSLIIVTEFATIYLNYIIGEKQLGISKFTEGEMSRTYIVVRNTLSTLYMTKNINNETNIEKMKYSQANKDNFLDWETLCRYYNLFITYGIFDEGKVIETNGKKLLTNKIIMPEAQAQVLIDGYFNKCLKMGL